MKIIKLTILSTLFVCAIGCSQSNESNSAEIAELKKRLQDLKKQNEDLDEKKSLKEDIKEITEVNRQVEEILKTKISGSCFITTRGGSAVKLSLVSVAVYEGEIQKKEAANFANSSNEYIANLLPEINKAYEEIKKALPPVLQAFVAPNSLIQEASNMEDSFQQLENLKGVNYTAFLKEFKLFTSSRSGSAPSATSVNLVRQKVTAYNSLVDNIDKLDASYKALNKNLRSKFDALQDLAAQANRILSPNYYRDGIIESIVNNHKSVSIVKTDADGKFELNLDRGKTYCLVAVAERLVGDSTEKYYWIVPLKQELESESAQLFLSNDNLTQNIPNFETAIDRTAIQKIESVKQAKEVKDASDIRWKSISSPSHLKIFEF